MASIKTSLGRLRVVGFWEGISFLVLLGIAMPLKYLAGWPDAVRVVGMAHGVFFCSTSSRRYRRRWITTGRGSGRHWSLWRACCRRGRLWWMRASCVRLKRKSDRGREEAHARGTAPHVREQAALSHTGRRTRRGAGGGRGEAANGLSVSDLPAVAPHFDVRCGWVVANPGPRPPSRRGWRGVGGAGNSNRS